MFWNKALKNPGKKFSQPSEAFIFATLSCILGIASYLLFWHSLLPKREVTLSQPSLPLSVSNSQHKPDSLSSPSPSTPFVIWKEKGKQAEEQGDIVTAIRCYTWALSYQYDQALADHLEEISQQANQQILKKQDLLQQAKSLQASYQYRAALAIYQRLAENYPRRQWQAKITELNNKLAKQQRQKKLLQKAQQLQKKHKFSQALRYYKKVLALGDTFPLKPVQASYEKLQRRLQVRRKVSKEIEKLWQQQRYTRALLYLQKLSEKSFHFPQLVQKSWTRFSQKMVLVPRGEFLLGSTNKPVESPRQKVFVESYYIDRYEVTNQQYGYFIQASDQEPPKHWQGRTPPKGKEQHPVTGISWQEAREYAQWANKRLPTEREWEKAARGEHDNIYPWGKQMFKDHANTLEQRQGQAVAVGSYPKGVSPYGCHDMIGNVSEWTSSSFQPYPGNEKLFFFRPGYRVARGGSWYYKAEVLSVSSRYPYPPNTRLISLGFRCAIDANLLVSPDKTAPE